MDLRSMRRDAAAVTQGYASYGALLEMAQRMLAAADYETAAHLYEQAVQAAPDDYAARHGVLMAKTKYLSEIPRTLPQHAYDEAMAVASPEEAKTLQEAWTKFELQHRRYWEGQRKAAEEKRERQRRRQEEKDRAERQRREDDARRAASSRRADADGKEQRRLHPVVRYLLIGAGAVLAMLGLAACATSGTGGGALFFLISLGALGSGRRNDRRD